MFSYIDPTVREQLVASGKLARIDAKGQRVDVGRPAGEVQDDVTLNVLGPIPLPIELRGRRLAFQWTPFVRHTELAKAEEIATALRTTGDKQLFPLISSYMAVNSALVWGDLRSAERPLVRVHSSCLTGDVFGSQRCECGPQLASALERISSDDSGAGVLVYMAGHEGRGIGLWAKAATYLLQDAGQDTYQANRSLGLPDDSRDFADAGAVLLHLLGGDRAFRLLTNNPKKRADLERCGLSRIEIVKHFVGANELNRRYLIAKRAWGHKISEDDL